MVLLFFVFLLLLYLFLVSPYPVWSGDTSKFQFLLKVWGTAHNPGYPLYIVLLHIWGKVCPLGTAAFKANLLQVFLSLATLTMLYSVGRKLGASDRVLLPLTLIAGGSPLFIRYATTAEVYIFLVFLGVSGIYLSVVKKHALLSWFLLSLAVSHHPLGIVFIPVYFALHGLPDMRKGILMLFLTLLAYVPYTLVIFLTGWSGSLYLESRAHNLIDLLGVIRGERFIHNMDFWNLGRNVLWFRKALEYLLKETSLLLPFVLYALFKVKRRDIHALSLSMALLLLIGTLYHINDIRDYFIVAVPFAFLIASVSLEEISGRWPVLINLLLLIGFAQVLLNAHRVARHNRNAERREREIRRAIRSLHDVALIGQNSYQARQRTLYYILGEGLFPGRRVYPIYYFSASAVKSYLCDGGEYPSRKNKLLLQGANPPPGLEVITVGRDYAHALEKVGCSLLAGPERSLYRVECECALKSR